MNRDTDKAHDPGTGPAADPQLPPPGLLTGLPIWLRWAILIAVTALLTAGFELARLPAALLIGAMAGGIACALGGARMSVPSVPFIGAQAVIACLVARAIDAEIVSTFAERWPLLFGVVLVIVLATSIMGYLMARSGVLPGTTAIWGTSAGAASAMVIMSGEHGGDPRLVAFMQYLRVIAVAMTASVIAAYGFGADAHPQQMVWFPPVDWQALAIMLGVAIASAIAGRYVPIPSGSLLLPTIVTAVLHAAGWLTIELPGWLLAIAYALVGWRVGLAFTRRILMHAFGALPQIAGSILVLIVFCAGLGWLVHLALGVDPLSAYLATSPGGLDAVAIIAASTPVDVQFVMALQTMRLIVIMLLGPWIARFVAGRLTGPGGKT